MSREVLQMALDALEHVQWKNWRTDKAIEALRAELAKPDGWQSIESAPKDGIILLGLPVIGRIKAEDRRVYEGRWHEDQSTWTSVNGFIILGCATHWMPLPHPPTP